MWPEYAVKVSESIFHPYRRLTDLCYIQIDRVGEFVERTSLPRLRPPRNGYVAGERFIGRLDSPCV